ncbi:MULTISPECIES: SDR family oxidoreductase [Actinoplanes]|uniref:SDR family NAD(P)-dependent oxidoreductase n=1 Tax=Actinoplanes TaxID=1865 RepID=UPI0005F2CEEE|nr:MULTISPECIES: SDR family oxidoreductase [Actinoplanes]
MSEALKDKVALVTGASHGIGRAIAERFAREGAAVGIGYGHDEAAATDTVDGIRKAGGRAFAVHSELGLPGDAARLWAAFDESGRDHAPDGKLDILVHNAAKASFGHLHELTEEGFDSAFAVSVRAPFFITKLALPRLRDGGRVITISSLSAQLAGPHSIAYGAAKGALNSFTLSLAQELGPRGITVNAVAPGVVMTRNNAYLLDESQAERRAATEARSALGRLGQPDDIAAVVAFLASAEGGWITGKVIDASGGTAL